MFFNRREIEVFLMVAEGESLRTASKSCGVTYRCGMMWLKTWYAAGLLVKKGEGSARSYVLTPKGSSFYKRLDAFWLQVSKQVE